MFCFHGVQKWVQHFTGDDISLICSYMFPGCMEVNCLINHGNYFTNWMFMSSLSAHGGLVHVVLCTRSMTSEGITVLVWHFMCLWKKHFMRVIGNSGMETGNKSSSISKLG